MSDTEFELDPRFLAGVKLLERTGALNFRLGHSHEDDGEPVVWYATCTWRLGTDGHPMPKGGRIAYEAAGAIDGIKAVLRLCEQVINGGQCVHCGRRTIFDDNPSDTPFDMLLTAMGCVYAWDPELRIFRRGCEGDVP